MRMVVHDLAHRFPGTDLLFEHLDMTVDPGMTVAVCGPSGCGKSTLLSILAGWEKPYAGSVERIGIARTGWVFQNPVGVAQRLMLARAVCSRPDMLLVDEPTAQLDTRTAHSVSHVLGNLANQGMIVLVATHDPDTRDACDHVVDLAHYAPNG